MASQPNPVNGNDSGIETRLAFIRSLLQDEFATTATEIKPIAYDFDFPWPYNNFVYLVTVEDVVSVNKSQIRRNQPGTQAVPIEKNEFILRLSNSKSGYNNQVRSENEVACLGIACDAMKSNSQQSLIPRVYGWGDSKDGKQGWILQERMHGQPLAEHFSSMTAEDQKKILGQMADILGYFQQYELPLSIDRYGGVRYDEDGRVVSGPMNTMDIGPFATYEDVVRGTIRWNLAESVSKPQLNGWKDSGIHERILKLLSNGLEGLMARLVSDRRKVLVHGDFTTDNCLYDPENMQITAVLDFDFARVGTVADECLQSLAPGTGRFPAFQEGEDTIPLRDAMLKGFPDPLSDSTDAIQWSTAKLWDDALRERNLSRPATIPGVESVAALFWLSSKLLPFMLTEEFIIKQSSKEKLAERKAQAEKELSDFLTEIGH